MTISIVIPVYNCCDYVRDCLDSIVRQTYLDSLSSPIHGSIECILVDDFSLDNSAQICEQYIANYQGPISFHLLHSEHNCGASAARNTGLLVATGEYVLFVDSDDWISDNCVAELVEKTKQYPGVQMVIAGIKTTDGSIPWFDFDKNPFCEYISDYHLIKTYYLGREILPTTPYNKLIPRQFILDNHLFFHEGIVIEDVLWCNLLAKYIHSIAVVNHSSYFYRIHKGSVVTSGRGVDPMRKLIVYDQMIAAIDEPFVQDQVEHLNEQLYKLYFTSEDLSLRHACAKSYRSLAHFAHGAYRRRLLLKSFFASFDHGDHSLSYYLFYQLDCGKSYLSILFTLIKKYATYKIH